MNTKAITDDVDELKNNVKLLTLDECLNFILINELKQINEKLDRLVKGG